MLYVHIGFNTWLYSINVFFSIENLAIITAIKGGIAYESSHRKIHDLIDNGCNKRKRHVRRLAGKRHL